MNAVAAAGGVLLVALVIIEVFNDLFHPTNSGALSDWLARHVFNLLRRATSLLPLAGPLSLVSTIAIWTLLLILGFALIFYGSIPDGFRTSVATLPPSSDRFLTAVYVSAQTLTTLAFGDIVANTTPMRAAATIEGLIGFAVVTASMSSIVLIYPALSRKRLLARGVAHLVAAQRRTGVAIVSPGTEDIVAELARQVTYTRIDFIHFPIVYFFASRNPLSSLAFAVDDLSRVARDGVAATTPAVRLAAAALDEALDDLSRVLDERFLHTQSTDRDEVFRAYARDHAIEHHHD